MQNIINPLLETIVNNYIIFVALLSVPVFFALQYLTNGIEYFTDIDSKVRYKYLAYMSILQILISLLVMWIIINMFSTEYLSDYQTLKNTAVVVLGASPFNVSILIWVIVKIEAYRFMKNRYGDDFTEEVIIKKMEHKEKKDNNVKKE